MKYQLVYAYTAFQQTKTDTTDFDSIWFDSIWDALKEAIRMLEETECKIKGITSGEDLFHEPNYILRSAAINSIWFSLSNCPDGYWRE